jgi:hypothetical protein
MSRHSSPIAAGFAAISHAKLVLLLALTTAALGVTAALPLMPALHDTMVDTLAGDHFVRNHPAFAPSDFLDFLREKESAVDGARHAVRAMALLGVLFQMFFAGGIVAVLGHGPFSFGQFLEPARRNLWHNIKCFFLFAIFAGVVLGIWLGGGFAARRKLLDGQPPDASIHSVTFWTLAIGGVLLFAVLSLLYDFARAARRFSPQIGAWRAFRFARRALSGSWTRALRLWLFWLLLGTITVGGLFAVTWTMPAVSRPAIAILMLLQFGVLCLRSAARVAAWGSYVEFLEPRAQQALSAVARVTIARAAPVPAPYSGSSL